MPVELCPHSKLTFQVEYLILRTESAVKLYSSSNLKLESGSDEQDAVDRQRPGSSTVSAQAQLVYQLIMIATSKVGNGLGTYEPKFTTSSCCTMPPDLESASRAVWLLDGARNHGYQQDTSSHCPDMTKR